MMTSRHPAGLFFCNVWDRKGSGIVGFINPNTRAGWLPGSGGRCICSTSSSSPALTFAVFAYLRWTRRAMSQLVEK
jgi:hypothetical protein